jgi:hypothetical protein
MVASVEIVSDDVAGSDGAAVVAGVQAFIKKVRSRKNEQETSGSLTVNLLFSRPRTA